MRARALRGTQGTNPLLAFAVVLFAWGAAVPAGADAPFVKVTAAPIDFGPVYATETFAAIGAVTITAPGGLSFRVALDGGFHFFGGSRHLKRSAGSEMIPYSLYSDAACTVAVGDADVGGTFAAGTSVASTGSGRDQLITVYGRLTVPAAAPPGLYVDSITVTVFF